MEATFDQVVAALRKCVEQRDELAEALRGMVECLKDSADFADCPLGKARAALAKVPA